MSHKEDALEEIVSIAKRNSLTLAEISAVMGGQTSEQSPQQKAAGASGFLPKLLGYFGGIFVFSGIGVFISMFWDDMGSIPRILVTLGTGFVLFFMGVVSIGDKKYERASTPLFLAAAIFQPGGIFVMLDEFSSGGEPRHGVLFMAIFMLIQQGATLWAKQRTVLAFTTIVFGGIFFSTLFDLMDLDENLIGSIMGASLLCIAYAANNSRHAAISPFWYFVGSAMLLCSVFDAVENSPLELLYLVVNGFLVFLSTYVRSRALLFVSVVGMLGYIGYFTAEHFANTLGWPVSLIFLGLVLIGLSSAAVKINNKYIKQQG